MHQLIKMSALILLSATVAQAVPAKERHDQYKVRIYNQCQLVSEHNMTAQQVAVYQRLMQHEQAMHQLEDPIKAIEPRMDKLTAQIEQISELAIRETGETLHINKSYLRQQQQIADQIEQLVAQHQSDFEALEQQGEKISAMADEFKQQMKPLTEGVEHDSIQIISPDKAAEPYRCYSGL
jgi:chromosome segregation ATPase